MKINGNKKEHPGTNFSFLDALQGIDHVLVQPPGKSLLLFCCALHDFH